MFGLPLYKVMRISTNDENKMVTTIDSLTLDVT